MQERIPAATAEKDPHAIIAAVIVVAAAVAVILLFKPDAGPEDEAAPAMAMVETPEAAVETPEATATQAPSPQETTAPAAQTQAEANIGEHTGGNDRPDANGRNHAFPNTTISIPMIFAASISTALKKTALFIL